MKKDISNVIGELCEFLGYNLSPEMIQALAKHVSIDSMRSITMEALPAEHKDAMKRFFRKGQVGDWKNYFEGQKLEEWNGWIAKNLEGTDIKITFE
jgi:phosphoglucomutase